MQLTFRFITGLLQPFSPKYLSRPDMTRHFNHVSVMEPGPDGTFDPGALYIGSAEKVRDSLPDNYIVIGDIDMERYPAPKKGNLSAIISGEQTTAGELIALIGNSFLSVGSMADDMLQSLSNSNHLFLCFRFTSALPSLQIRFKAAPIDWTDSGHTAKVLKV